MNKPIPAAVTKVTTLRDRTTRLQVDCQEIPAEQMAELFTLNDTLGWFFFHEKPIKEIDTSNLPEIKFERGEKTPSTRLRGALYVYWQQLKKDVTFEQFYREQMERFIEAVKEKLD